MKNNDKAIYGLVNRWAFSLYPETDNREPSLQWQQFVPKNEFAIVQNTYEQTDM